MAPLPDSASDALTTWIYDIGWKIARTLPESAANATFRQIADALWYRRAGGVNQLERNLRRVHPDASEADIRDLSRAGMRSYMRYWCEAFRLPTWSRERITETFVLGRQEILDTALETGGALVIPGHMANWDHAGAWVAATYGSVTSVAERVKPEKLFDAFMAYRTKLGMDIYPTGHPNVLDELAGKLQQGKVVALVGDRDISRRGVHVDFFGEPASFPVGPATLALATGVPLHPVTMWFDGDICRSYLHDRVEVPMEGDHDERVRAITQQLAHGWEAGIIEHSADWHMLQKVWVSDLTPRREAP